MKKARNSRALGIDDVPQPAHQQAMRDSPGRASQHGLLGTRGAHSSCVVSRLGSGGYQPKRVGGSASRPVQGCSGGWVGAVKAEFFLFLY